MEIIMIRVYDVQTFYGTHLKTFQNPIHAQQYWVELKKNNECMDPIMVRNVTEEEFCYEDIED